MADKVSVQHLPVMQPPLPSTGGRFSSPAGEMAQVINGEAMRLVTYIEFRADGKPRGNHFHREKVEIIYIIRGRLKAIYIDLDANQRQEVELKTGDLVRVQPNCAHVYIAEEYTQALELNAVPYDPADTVPYQIDI